MIRRCIVVDRDDVNHKFAPAAGRSDSIAAAPFARAGGTFRGRVAGHSRDGPVAHLQSSRAAEARRSGGRSAIGKKCLLWSEKNRGPKWRGRAGPGSDAN